MNRKVVWSVQLKKQSTTIDRDIEDNSSDNTSYWNSLYGIIILLACILYGSFLTLIPRQNSILYPDYWYETLFLFGVISIRNSALLVTELFIFTNEKTLASMSLLFKSFLGIWVLWSLPYCVGYLLWTHYYGNYHPMPFIGAMCSTFYEFVILIACWLLIPSSLKTQTNLRKQIKYYIIYRLWIFVILMQGNILQSIARILPSNFEWILSVLIPASVTANSTVLSRISRNVKVANMEMLNNLLETTVMVIFTVFVTTRLSSLNESTVYSILAIEFVIHMKELYDIVKAHRKIQTENTYAENQNAYSNRRGKVEMLILSEYIEGISPLAYAIGFAMAYYGFNATLIKDVRNAYFGGKIIDNIDKFYTVMFQMFSIDAIAMILSSVVLYYYCKINFFKEFCGVMKRNWIILIVKLPVLTQHFGHNDINFGLDYTMKFLWITAEGRNQLISNDSNLSMLEKSILTNETIL